VSATSFVADILQKGIILWVEDGELCLEASTGVLTPALREKLLERKGEIVALLGKDRRYAAPSYSQQRLWFIDQLEPDSTAYSIPTGIRLSGRLDTAALRQSLEEIVRRHETLRTTFAAMDGRAVQVIAAPSRAVSPIVDLEGLAESEREAQARQSAEEEARRSFDLASGPLVRTVLLQLGETEHVLLLTMHHVIFDDWSMGILIRELAMLYEAFSAGEPSPLPELPIQYSDFTVWQRERLQGEVLEKLLAYWKERLSNAPVLELPTDRVRPPVQTYRGATELFVLPKTLVEKLRALSQREGVTLFMTLLAAFKALLCRYTGQTDIVVGTPIANRNWGELEQLIGFFANTLLLRTDLRGNPTVRELLGRVREGALGAYAHQDVPFEMLVEYLQPERDLSRSPLFQVMFVLRHTATAAVEVPGLTMELMEVDSGTAQFDLTLMITEKDGRLEGELEYSTDLFDPSTARRVVLHFEKLLEGVVAAPDRRLSCLPLLTKAEQCQLLVEWNDTTVDYSRDRCIHELFEEQARQTPDAVAAVFPAKGLTRGQDQHLTYHELNQRADRLADYLQSLGVGPEVLVGICVERSLEMVIGLLGILKARGAYLPLDPTYPREWLMFVLEDTQAPVVLTQKSLVMEMSLLSMAENGQFTPVYLDEDWEAACEREAKDTKRTENSGVNVTSLNLAYVIYTSGSTGQPKGVQIVHRAVVNFLEALRELLGFEEKDVLFSVTSLSFDIAGLELLLPLVSGGKVVLADDMERLDGACLETRLAESSANLMQATPVTWRLLLASEWTGSGDLQVLCGGEAFPRDLANELLERVAVVWNMYGPTETTIWSSVHQVGKGERSVPIGLPIANTQMYVLDKQMNPVGVGTPGELYIGGDGMARGYLNRPALTAERFVVNPFSENGERLYQTGDLVRHLPDGEIEFLGRTDFQVKIRGFRIEIGEIEAVLCQHPAVQEVVVLALENGYGGKRLVAYIVPTRDDIPATGELRGYLREKLPDYMIPSAFVMLGEMPLTPNGKVNRQALPAPDSLRYGIENVFVAPRTPVEGMLADILSDVLGVERIGIYDSFFELGGHSLLATQVISRLREALQLEIPLRVFFDEPTVAGLAQAVDDFSSSALIGENGVVIGNIEEGEI
jgi:amino acid adenylation domain-containing protein